MARDKFHQQVRIGLEQEGWHITHDPLYLKVGNIPVHIDLGAEQLLGAEKNGQRIAIEIKTFGEDSFITAFYGAIGKYIVYRKALSLSQEARKLYLALPEKIYKLYQNEPIVSGVFKDEKIFLILYDSESKTIKQWIE